MLTRRPVWDPSGPALPPAPVDRGRPPLVLVGTLAVLMLVCAALFEACQTGILP